MTMNEDTKGVRQVLWDVSRAGYGMGFAHDLQNTDKLMAGEAKRAVERAEVALQEIMLGMLPEEHEWTEAPDENLNAQEVGEVDGWNGCREIIEQNIRGGFNNG